MAVAGSVAISAFVALSLSPMMASRMLKPAHEAKHNFIVRGFDRMLVAFTRGYKRLLIWSLAHRVVLLAIGRVGIAAGVILYRGLEKEFLPEEDKSRLMAFVVAPEGSTPEYTDRMLKELEGIVMETPEVRSYGSVVAPSFQGPGQANSGILFVRLKDRDQRQRSVQEIVSGPGGLRGKFFSQVEGALAIPQIPKAIGRSGASPFQLVIQTEDLAALDKYCRSLADKLRQSGYLFNVRSSSK